MKYVCIREETKATAGPTYSLAILTRRGRMKVPLLPGNLHKTILLFRPSRAILTVTVKNYRPKPRKRTDRGDACILDRQYASTRPVFIEEYKTLQTKLIERYQIPDAKC